MKGPLGKGHAEMAVSKTKNSDYVTPDYDGDFPIQGWDEELPFPPGTRQRFVQLYDASQSRFLARTSRSMTSASISNFRTIATIV